MVYYPYEIHCTFGYRANKVDVKLFYLPFNCSLDRLIAKLWIFRVGLKLFRSLQLYYFPALDQVSTK